MGKSIVFFLFLLVTLWAGEKEDFQSLTNEMKFSNVRLDQQDREVLDFYAGVYEKNVHRNHAQSVIPKTLHFIWLGPSPFPIQSVRKIKLWKKAHPDWELFFWTDSRYSPLPVEGMQRRLVTELPFALLSEEFYESDNWGEKSDLLRYEILYREGGVYVDHDVECLQPIDPFTHFDFFCCLEPPHRNPGRRLQVFPGNAIFGTVAFHPTLLCVMQEVKALWKSVGEEYPYRDFHSETARVLNRTFNAFSSGVLQTIDNDRINLILPPPYFFYPDLRYGKEASRVSHSDLIYAIHTFSGSWSDGSRIDISPSFRKTFSRYEKITKKWMRRNLILSGGNALLLGALFFFYRRRKQ